MISISACREVSRKLYYYCHRCGKAPALDGEPAQGPKVRPKAIETQEIPVSAAPAQVTITLPDGKAHDVHHAA